MAKFPSEEWMNEFVNILKSSETYREAAKDWEGDITFIVTPESSGERSYAMWFDLYHGECRDAKFFDDVSKVPKSAFSYSGPLKNWISLIEGKIDPIRGLMTGKFKLGGPMMKIMRYTKAAKELVNTAAKVKTEF